MPTLPLAPPFALSTVGTVVRDLGDVLAVLPAEYDTDDHPVLDALAKGLLAMLREHGRRADYAAAQADVTRATDIYLDGLGNDRTSPRAAGEPDYEYRLRTCAWKEIATPTAIIATANAILAPHTTAQPQLFESILDRWYVHDGTDGDGGPAAYTAFVGDGLSNVAPSYPDRLYRDDIAANEGFVRPQSSPGGAIVFEDGNGRMFVLRIPELNDTDSPRSFAFADGATDSEGFFVSDGTGGPSEGLAFVSNNYRTADETYQAIANSVQQIKGHGVRFLLLVDRKL